MALTLSHYRFGIDQGTESTHGWYANQDTPPQQGSLPLDAPFLLRFCVQATGGVAHSNIDFEFQYRRNGGTWTNITTTSTVVKAVAATALTNGGNCTKQLSGTGTFESSGAGQTEDGTSGGTANDIVANGNTETECGLQIISADVTSGDTLEFRLTNEGGSLLNTYAVTASYQLATPPQAVLITGVQGGNPLRFLMAPGNGIDPVFDNTGMPNISADWGSTSLAIVLGTDPPTGAALRGKMYLNSTVGYIARFETYVASTSMAAGTFISMCVGKEINALDFDDGSVLIAWYLKLENIAGTLKFTFSFPTATGEQFNTWSGTVSVNETYKHYIEYNLVTDHIIYKVNDQLVVDWPMDASAVQSIGTIVMGSSGGSTARDTVLLIDRIEEFPVNYISGGITQALTGVAGTGQTGTLTPPAGGTSAALVGAGAASAIGALAMAVSIALSGVGGTGAVGTLSPTRSVASSGVAATSAIGTVTETHTRSLVGAAGTGATGTETPVTAKAMTGQAGTGVVGSVTPTQATIVGLTGVQGTGARGVVSAVFTPALNGTAATGAVGTVSTQGNVTAALTGLSGTGAVGTVSPSGVTNIALTGVSANATVGTVTLQFSQSVTGVTASSAIGAVARDPQVMALTGVVGTGALGVASLPATYNPVNRPGGVSRTGVGASRTSATLSGSRSSSVLSEVS